MLRFTTAGESHGRALIAIVEGLPAGLELRTEHVNAELGRRQLGYGRGDRMRIERDQVEFLSGVRLGFTIGSPVAMSVRNRDWENWQEVMDPAPREDTSAAAARSVTRPRPGHADLTGVLKYDRVDARDILERASARETVARTAAGAVCKQFLIRFGIGIGSHVVQLGAAAAAAGEIPLDINAAADRSPVRTLDPRAEAEMLARIDDAKRAGETLGGICEVVATGVPVGLGSHVTWDRRIDGRLAAALMSIPAVKGVEFGTAFAHAAQHGSEVHDAIFASPESGADAAITRSSNRAGGVEGGMTTGERLVVRAAMKPLSTLMQPLQTVDLGTGAPARAVTERSDVTAVPAMGVVAEAMVAFVLAQAFLEKFGGDSVAECARNYDSYAEQVRERFS